MVFIQWQGGRVKTGRGVVSGRIAARKYARTDSD